MKNTFFAIFFTLFYLPSLASQSIKVESTIATGSQPQISVDNKGTIRVVFGKDDKVLCAHSDDHGLTFSQPVLIGTVPGMHLGMSRGPQLATSGYYSIVTAMDKGGNIHWFKLNHSSARWKDMGVINDVAGSAPEGLMHVAADKNDNFYAVWLDIRTSKHNQIYFSSLNAKAVHWSKNVLLYQSPEGHVCECCQPHVAVYGPEVAVMFRNWVNGSRDLYLMKSVNQGQSFTEPKKLGLDTWKLNGCPMDGGGIAVNSSNSINTTWQRQGAVYYCKPGESEVYIGKGRNCSLSSIGDKVIIIFQNQDTIKLINTRTKKETFAGRGGFPKSVLLPGNDVVVVWERDNKVRYRKLSNEGL